STLLTLLAVTLPALGGCQSLPASEDLLASLEAAERARFEAWVSGDVERIRPFLAEELVYCHTNGICQTRDELLEAMGAGATVYRGMDILQLRPPLAGHAGIVNGTVRIRAEDRGKPIEVKAVYTDVYVNRDGRWLLTAWQSTRAAER